MTTVGIGPDSFLELEVKPRIPGNGIVYAGQEIDQRIMYLELIPPHPPLGKQRTIDYLVKTEIQPHSEEEQLAKTRELLQLYDGLEPAVLNLLSLALRKGKFKETVSLLKEYYSHTLSKETRPPELRCTSRQTFLFFEGLERQFEPKLLFS